jgi:hypothetical protein
MKLENFKLIEFYNQNQELQNEYIHILKYLKPRETKKKLFDMTLDEVTTIKTSSSDGEIVHCISLMNESTDEEVLDLPIIDFFAYFNFMQQELKNLNEIEKNNLTPTYTNPKWDVVGGNERMQKFGILNTLDMLAGGNILNYKEILKMKYSEIFAILLMRKEKNEIEYEISKLK